jgi:sugar phosphate isomerase/epimerase
MALRYGYNTNGLAHHRLEDALRLVADLGYDGCALTLDHHHLDPFAPDLPGRTARVGALAQELGLGLVIETGARFLLDPRRKHEPTLLSPEPEGRARRAEFLERSMDIAADLGAECVSLWSGGSGDPDRAGLWERMLPGVEALARAAERRGVVLGFEPEPGMLVECVDDYLRLRAAVDSPALRMTLDLGHCILTEPGEPADAVRRCAGELVNVHAEDMRRPRHEHLPFGEGEMDYAPILRALAEMRYDGLVNVELSRDSHRGPEMARAALAFLRAAEAAPATEEAGARDA